MARIVVTGASGFVGRLVVRELLDLAAARDTEVAIRAFDLRPLDHPAGVETIVGDLTDREGVRAAIAGADAVVHVAAIVDWGQNDPALLDAVNVGGTRNVIDACVAEGVRALVHTSTMDVVMTGGDLRRIDESQPVPDAHFDAYSGTKAEAERVVLASNGRPTAAGPLRTAVLRPCGVYGEADPYHLTQTLLQVKSGALKFRIGSGDEVFEHVYAGNVAYAHALLAFEMLDENCPAAGEAFFVTDQPAINFFDFMAPFVEALGHEFPPRDRSIPYRVIRPLAALMEDGAKLIRPFVKATSPLTRSSIDVLCHDISIETDKAERLFGYRPRYSTEEAFERTVAWFRANAV